MSSKVKNYMISYQEALDLVRANGKLMGTEAIQLENALGRILAAEVTARENVPPFDNTAMDGYAVVSADLAGASKEKPVSLKVVGLSAAGEMDLNDPQNRQNTAWKIMTGAPVPAGYDAIIPVENTQLENDQVSCFSAPEQGAHIRLAGQDFVKDETYLSKSSFINSNIVMALATLGRSEIPVFKKPKIAVFATGKELVDDLDAPLQPGQIRNSNKPYILSWLSQFPVDCIDAGTNHDEEDKFRASLQYHLDQGVDMIISSGAVSMGDFDFVPAIIQALGGEIIFHKSKIRPGKPILFARFPNGTLYFGLPGNPISAAIGLRFFVGEALASMLGQQREQAMRLPVLQDFDKKPGFRMICKSSLVKSKEAPKTNTIAVDILDGQQSFKIKPMITTDGWLVIEESLDRAIAGERYEFYPNLPVWINH